MTTDTVTATACQECGVAVVHYRVPRRNGRPRAMALNAAEHPTGPWMTHGEFVVWDPQHRYEGGARRIRHQCERAPSRCKYCSEPVLVLNLDPATPPERMPSTWLIVVDPEPTPDGPIRMTADGWARWRTHDDDWGYPWHTKH